MSTCKIGPVTIDRGFYYERNNDYGVMDGREKFTVKGPIWNINQLRGLVTRGKSKESGDVRVRGSNSNDWGPVWIDAAYVDDGDSRDNVRLNHKGWYLIRSVEVEHVNEHWAKAELEVELLSTNPLQYMEYDYTDSSKTSNVLPFTYDLVDEVVLFEDDFSSLDTTDKWVDVGSWNLTNSNIGVTGGKLYMEGRKTLSSQWAGARILRTRRRIKTPFTIEFDLEFNDTSSYDPSHDIHLTLSPIIQSLTERKDAFLNIFRVAGNKRYYALVRAIVGGYTWAKEYTTDTKRKWRWDVGSDGNITVYQWDGSKYVKQWSGSMGLSSSKELYVSYLFHGHADVSNVRRAYADHIKIYRTRKRTITGGVTVPAPNTGRLITAPDETTPNTAFYHDPAGRILLQTDKDDLNKMYINSPVGWSSNNPGGVYRQVTGDYERLSPNKFYVTNGIILLDVKGDGIELRYVTSTGSMLVNKFSFGTIDYLQVLNATPESFKFQANRTEWELRRGESFVRVKHEHDSLFYSKKNSYYHDASLYNNPNDNSDITMLTQPYCLAYNPYNLLPNANASTFISSYDEWNDASSNLSLEPPGYHGNYRLRVVTKNLTTYEGIYQKGSARCVIPTNSSGLKIQTGAMMKGTGTFYFYFAERDINGEVITSSWGSDKNLVNYWDWNQDIFEVTSNQTAQIELQVLTKAQSSSTLDIDLIVAQPTPISGITQRAEIPNQSHRYGLMIIKNNPTVIKCDSIPPSPMTGIGVYDQMTPPISFNHFLNKSYQYLNSVDGRLRLVQR